VFTLCAMSLGVGVFVLPAVLKSIGFISGVVSIVFFALWSYWLQIVLVRVGKAYVVHPFS
jgi:amino acid permease